MQDPIASVGAHRLNVNLATHYFNIGHYVRFGSKADICGAKGLSALRPKADTCSAILERVIPIKSPISLQLHQCVGRFRKAGQSPDRLPQYWLAIGGSQ